MNRPAARACDPVLRGALFAGLAFLGACTAPPPDTLGPTSDGLAPCPHAPNCIHTGDGHPEGVSPLILTDDWQGRPSDEVWAAIESAVASLPRTEIVLRTDDYLHAESRSRVFGFTDDLEVYRVPDSPELVVRSEARVGRSDMGVNMRRVESLREALQARGVVETAARRRATFREAPMGEGPPASVT